jgi:hypothetical protein
MGDISKGKKLKKACHASERWHPGGMAFIIFWRLFSSILKAGKTTSIECL